MKFSIISFILTDDCNFRCAYCFQTKSRTYISSSTIEKSARFFYPYLTPVASVVFFGGEPLMAMDNIKRTVDIFDSLKRVQPKEISYYITTNGSLITPEILQFFDRYKFELMLSFDGFTQETARCADSFERCRNLIREIPKYPGIHFCTNSVFTPENVNTLSATLISIIEDGVNDTLLSISPYHPWGETQLSTLEEQLNVLVDYLTRYFKVHGIIPVRSFRPSSVPKPVDHRFVCTAGNDRINVDPLGNIWGCHLFYDLVKERKDIEDANGYLFGHIDDFIANHQDLYPKAMEYYSDLRQDCFFASEKFCFTCEEVEHCGVCPVNAAYTTHLIGKIPPHICLLNKIQYLAKIRLHNLIKA